LFLDLAFLRIVRKNVCPSFQLLCRGYSSYITFSFLCQVNGGINIVTSWLQPNP
jgi:hypothetical protein